MRRRGKRPLGRSGVHERRARRAGKSSDGVVQRLAAECVEVAVGLEACARHARDPRTAEVARPLAAELRQVSDHAWSLGVALGSVRHRGPRTCERLRWEWLASTAALLDGSPDARLVAECVRLAAAARDDARAAELAAAGPVRRAARAIAVALDRVRALAEASGRTPRALA